MTSLVVSYGWCRKDDVYRHQFRESDGFVMIHVLYHARKYVLPGTCERDDLEMWAAGKADRPDWLDALIDREGVLIGAVQPGVTGASDDALRAECARRDWVVSP